MLLLIAAILTCIITGCGNDDESDVPYTIEEGNTVVWKDDTLKVTHAQFSASMGQDSYSADEASIVLWLDNTGHDICWVSCKNDDVGKLIKLNGSGEYYDIYLDINSKRQSWYRHNDDKVSYMGDDSYIKISRNGSNIYSIDVKKSTSPTLYVHYRGTVEEAK